MARENKGGGTKSRLFFRIHWNTSKKFSRTNAFSAPWGEDSKQLDRGYSCFGNPVDLFEYFENRSGLADEAKLVVFEGTPCGVGSDNEDLVVPMRSRESFRAFLKTSQLQDLCRIWEDTDSLIEAEEKIIAYCYPH